MTHDPSARIKAIYFLYLAAVGLLVTFVPYHLQALGLGASEIGLIFTLRTVVGTVAAPAVARLSDRLGRTVDFLRLALVWSFACALGLPLAVGFVGVATSLWLQAPLQVATVPLLDATIVRTRGARDYGRVRLWGSLGFGVVISVFGIATRSLSYDDAGRLAVWVYAALAGIGALVAVPLRPIGAPQERVRSGGFMRMALSPRFVAFLLFNMIHWSGVMMYNVFFALHTRALGLGTEVPGLGVAISIAAEVMALSWSGRLLERIDPAAWLVPCFLATALRWFGTAETTSPVLIIALQSLHFFTFGMWFAAAIRMLDGFAPPSERAGVQGLFNAGVFGVGGAVGIPIAGLAMEARGGEMLFLVAAATSVLAAIGYFVSRLAFPGRPAPA